MDTVGTPKVGIKSGPPRLVAVILEKEKKLHYLNNREIQIMSYLVLLSVIILNIFLFRKKVNKMKTYKRKGPDLFTLCL